MNLLEVVSPQCRILSEKVDEATGERVMRVQVKWQMADVINGNRRRYSKAILQREITRLTPLIEQGRVSGASFHPEALGELDDISHLWESIRMEQDGACTGVVKVIPTVRGKNAQAIIKAGGHIGMSSRGTGSVTKKEEVVDGKKVMVEEVNNDFVLHSPGDFVLSPSVLDAGVMRMMESRLDGEIDPAVLSAKGYKTIEELNAAEAEEAGYPYLGPLMNIESEEDAARLLRARYEVAFASGFRGTIKEYRDQFLVTSEERLLKEKYEWAKTECGYKGTFEQYKESLKEK